MTAEQRRMPVSVTCPCLLLFVNSHNRIREKALFGIFVLKTCAFEIPNYRANLDLCKTNLEFLSAKMMRSWCAGNYQSFSCRLALKLVLKMLKSELFSASDVNASTSG
jgi:hypothetical protein